MDYNFIEVEKNGGKNGLKIKPIKPQILQIKRNVMC